MARRRCLVSAQGVEHPAVVARTLVSFVLTGLIRLRGGLGLVVRRCGGGGRRAQEQRRAAWLEGVLEEKEFYGARHSHRYNEPPMRLSDSCEDGEWECVTPSQWRGAGPSVAKWAASPDFLQLTAHSHLYKVRGL